MADCDWRTMMKTIMEEEEKMNHPMVKGRFEIARNLVEEVRKKAMREDADNVLKVIDDYCWNFVAAMNVGDTKGKILDEIFTETDPKIVLELGSYIGYSTTRMARLLKKPESHLYTVEMSEEFAGLTKEVLAIAGLSEKVTVIVGPSTGVISTLSETYGIDKLDFVFIDHLKSFYKRDLIKLIETGLVQKGTVVVADNILCPGAPEYAEYVRTNPKFKTKFHESHYEYSTEIKDGIEESVYLG